MDKRSILGALWAMYRERNRLDLDSFTIGDWLAIHGATAKAVEHFWRPILVSALNEEPARASAQPAFHVVLESLMKDRLGYQIGIPSVPLKELYSSLLEARTSKNIRFNLRSSVNHINPVDRSADYYISAVSFEQVRRLIPTLELPLEKIEHSPITGIHLWFDREITRLPHAILLDRTIQWVFRKSANYIQCVVSASRSLVPLSRNEIIEIARNELSEFFPETCNANLLKSHVIKEPHATYSTIPGLEEHRPHTTTRYPNLFLAGDWTQTGWPATMEGAVRSGYRAAEAVTAATGHKSSFLLA